MASINLKQKYKELNEELFSGQLTDKVRVRWTKAKYYSGKNDAYFDIDTGELLECRIGINRYYQNSTEDFLNTLVHEMIHVKIAMMGREVYKQEQHGSLFQAEADRINRDFPRFIIDIKEEIFRPVSDDNLTQFHGFVIKTVSGDNHFNLYHKQIDRDLFILILQYLSLFPEFDGGSVYSFSGVYPTLGQATVRKNKNTLLGGLQATDSNVLDDFFEESERNCKYQYKLESHDNHFLLKKENGFSKAVYPEFYKASDDEIVVLKMLVEV